MVASTEALAEAVDLIQAYEQHQQEHKREYAPDWYDWQRDLFAAGASHRERMVLCGNRGGKTSSAGYEFALHATGDYPAWWNGVRLLRPKTIWCLGVDNTQVRDVLQQELIGRVNDDGTVTGGWIHPSEVVKTVRAQTPGLCKDIFVRNRAGSETHISLKTYTQSSTGQSTLPFAGSSVDAVLVDEQPPDDIVGQLVTRTMTGRNGQGGIVLYSMTPELGMTALVAQFMENSAPHQYLVGPIAWDQCPHLTPSIRAEILAGIPEHEREMRSLGVPMMGEGRIFTAPESDYVIEPFDLTPYPWWRCIRAIDLGIGHPASISWLAFDPDTQTTYLVRNWRKAGEIPAVHMSVANSQWAHAPLVVPHDIDSTEKSGADVRDMYVQAGMSTALNFKNPGEKESNFVEPGILAMQQAMRTDRFKVFNTCTTFLEEARTYHRKKGKIVKERDDAIDSVRYGFQMIARYGVPIGEAYNAIGSLVPSTGLQRENYSRTRGMR